MTIVAIGFFLLLDILGELGALLSSFFSLASERTRRAVFFASLKIFASLIKTSKTSFAFAYRKNSDTSKRGCAKISF